MEQLNLVQELLKDGCCVAIAEREIINQAINELYELEYIVENVDEFSIELGDCDVLALIKCGNEFSIEYPFDEDDELIEYCGERILVEKKALTDDQYESLNYEEIITFVSEDDLEEPDEEDVKVETIEEFAEVMADTFIEEIDEALENGRCAYCTIKEKLIEMFLDGYETGRDEVEDIILESLGY